MFKKKTTQTHTHTRKRGESTECDNVCASKARKRGEQWGRERDGESRGAESREAIWRSLKGRACRIRQKKKKASSIFCLSLTEHDTLPPSRAFGNTSLRLLGLPTVPTVLACAVLTSPAFPRAARSNQHAPRRPRSFSNKARRNLVHLLLPSFLLPLSLSLSLANFLSIRPVV